MRSFDRKYGLFVRYPTKKSVSHSKLQNNFSRVGFLCLNSNNKLILNRKRSDFVTIN